MSNWFMTDDVESNKLWGYDYCFCGSNCKRKDCGRNTHSKSYREMLKDVGYHSMADFTDKCDSFEPDKGDDDVESI